MTETPEPRRLTRSSTDRVIGGVAGGIAAYFKIDPIIVRLAAIGLALLGGVGVLLYLAAMLLVPEEGGAPPTESRTRTVLGVVVLVVAGLILLPAAGFLAGGVLFPLGLLAVLGLGAWWLSSGRPLAGTPGQVAWRIAAGLGILTACGLVLVAGAWAAAAGGGTLAAGLVIGAGLAVTFGAFMRPVRWLILPALSLALGVGIVAAAGIDTDGGVGDRDYHPTLASDVRDRYELGAGELVLDLRDVEFTGDRRVELEIGMGHAIVLVPEDVCLSTDARVGAGALEIFDRQSGGIDVDWEDDRAGLAGAPLLLLDAEVGLGKLDVDHDPSRIDDEHWNGGWRNRDSGDNEVGNRACAPRA
jgi:phage shock protein PspC (stress-responsive transcriptional regulator)